MSFLAAAMPVVSLQASSAVTISNFRPCTPPWLLTYRKYAIGP